VSWQLASLCVLGVVLVGGFAWYERERPPARVLALVAALAALAVVGRLAFAAIPNVKPTTDIVIFAGYSLGAVPGFAVGAVTALVSNIFLSQGPWTAWQMVGWGGCGVAAALLARAMRGRELGRVRLAIFCGLAGFAFGAWMDVYQWTLAARQDLDSYLAVAATSLPYNLAHAIGNVVFCLLIGPLFVRSLRRYRRRFEVSWAPRRAAVASALLAVVLAAAGGGHSAARAAPSSTQRAAHYLLGAQNKDGGFGGARGQSSTDLHTGWAALGLAATRHNPRDVHRRGGKSITSYLKHRAGSIRDIGEIERTVMVLRASGLSPRKFAGHDYVAAIRARRRADGSISGFVSYTAFGVLALRSAGVAPGDGTIAYLRKAQNGDGGFGLTTSAASDTDMTGAVLQALAAGGTGAPPGAIDYLRASQNADGGFGQFKGRSSNAQSTAYAIQGLIAAKAPAGMTNRAIGYLKSLQRGDGSIRYSRGSTQTPVWVTAQALAALRRKPLPLGVVPRKKHKRAHGRKAGAAPAGAAAAGGGGAAAGAKAGASKREKQRKAAAKAAGGAVAGVEAGSSSRGAGASLAPDFGTGSAPVAGGDAERRTVSATTQGGTSVSGWLVALAIVAVLAPLVFLRRRLRRRRAAGVPPGSPVA
jgi:energy-coupling factor transport system substrate-specific component